MHHANNNIIEKLKKTGERITPIRVALIDILSKTQSPSTPQELLKKLAKKKFKINKTTIYRQLEALQRVQLIQKVNFTDRTKRYEMVSEKKHHHHMVCLQCKRIEDVVLPDNLEQHEKTIWGENKFKVTQHSLEFFGICQTCLKLV